MARSRQNADGAFKVGDTLWSSRSSAPSGWLACDGSAISRTTYSALFTALGTTFGAGDGTTTFNLPDAQGRAPVGVGSGSGLTTRALGAKGGAETHPLALGEMPAHTHGVTLSKRSDIGGSGSRQALVDPADAPTGTYTATSASQGSGTAHNNMQPYLALNCFIYAGV
jgi:microcystin-dependent protein